VKRQRHTPEQIIRKLRTAEQMLSEGKTPGEAAKALEVSEQTLHRWRKYGGMKAPCRRAWRPGQHPLRQWPRADRRRPAGMVPAQLHRHRLHRARLALAERLRGVLQLPPA
jgi:transposase-like protein